MTHVTMTHAPMIWPNLLSGALAMIPSRDTAMLSAGPDIHLVPMKLNTNAGLLSNDLSHFGLGEIENAQTQ